ncbi:MAG: DNA repair protein RecN [Sedimenticola sp.]|nr:DNA repair protein RecN [Sedimenticola sp.]
MLQQIEIKDLAIVSTLSVELSAGMSVLTGETGAGKSILIDALGLVLGDRADNGMIRDGCERAEVSALFDTRELPAVENWLEENALDNDGQCILRRVLLKNGSSRAFINGTPANLKSLQQLGDQLVNIHGQHAHQSLLKQDHQRQLLDEYAGHLALCNQTADSFRQWRTASQRLSSLRQEAGQRQDRLDMLRYQINELESLQLEAGELEELLREQALLNNAGNIVQHCDGALNSLDQEDDGALTRVNRACNELATLLELDPTLKECAELLDSASIQIGEALSTLRHYADNLELDPARLEHLNRRLQEIHDLARKYRCKPDELDSLLQQRQDELSALDDADSQLAGLENQVTEFWSGYLEQAERLGRSRREAAGRLREQVTDGMQSLGMPSGILDVEVERLGEERASAHGLDRVELRVSTNPGQSPKPLVKVASGGELSRISLAIQVATAACTRVPTLIFDEVDVGIGGGTAEIVGRLLRQLGERQQVLCVTHLPQVASQGHQHLQVEKQSNSERTGTRLSVLEGKQRIEEIARMLGGVEITSQTLAHAEEMLMRTGTP